MTIIHISHSNDLSGSEIGIISYALRVIYDHDESLIDEDRQKIKALYNKLHGEDIL